MKKLGSRVALRKEVVRVLANHELTRAVGGDVTDVQSSNTNLRECPLLATQRQG
jgi:hypothetical protein